MDILWRKAHGISHAQIAELSRAARSTVWRTLDLYAKGGLEAARDMAAALHIELLFLPSYSPNLDLIERLGRFTKKAVHQFPSPRPVPRISSVGGRPSSRPAGPTPILCLYFECIWCGHTGGTPYVDEAYARMITNTTARHWQFVALSGTIPWQWCFTKKEYLLWP